MASSSAAQEPPEDNVKVAKFEDILRRGPYAVGLRGVSKSHVVGAKHTPNARVVQFSWQCGREDKHGKKCGKDNKIDRTKCARCQGGILDHRNVKKDRQGRSVQAGDELNMVPRRLLARYWECGTCHRLRTIRSDTIVSTYCGHCLDDDVLSEVEGRTWVWNEFRELLGSFDGMTLVELNPWMDSLWAAASRQDKGIPFTVIE